MAFVKELLKSKSADVWTVATGDTVYEALQLMAEKNIGAVPVLQDGRLVGMFSERDYARKVILMGKSSRVTTVGELMSAPVISVGPDETIETCMALMTEHRIRHLPVLEDGALFGILSSGDVLKSIVVNQEVLIRDLENYIVGRRS